MQRKQIFISVFLIAVVVAWLIGVDSDHEREVNELRAKIAVLRDKVASLERDKAALQRENRKLRETAQSYYRRAVDMMGEAASKSDLKKARDELDALIVKFPESPYVPEARKQIAAIDKRISDIEATEKARAEFDDALKAHRFSEAAAALKRLQPLIGKGDYARLRERFDEEKNRPVETTINKIVTDWGRAGRHYDFAERFRMDGMRVRFDAEFASIDRERMMVRAYDVLSGGITGGSSWLEVDYEESNLRDYLTRNDPFGIKCRVTGRIVTFRDWIYVKAERIELMGR